MLQTDHLPLREVVRTAMDVCRLLATLPPPVGPEFLLTREGKFLQGLGTETQVFALPFILLLLGGTPGHPKTSRDVNPTAGRKYLIHKLN